MKRHCRGLWQSSLAVGEAENAAVACIVEMKPGIAVVVGSAKTVDVVSRVELKKAAGAGIGAAKTVAVASRLELKEAAADAAAAADIETTTTTTAADAAVADAAAGIETTTTTTTAADAAAAAAAAVGIATTKAAAVAGVLLNILRPHARTGDTGLEQSAADCVAQRVVAGVTGAFGFVVVRRAEVDLQVGNTQQTDMPDSDLDMKGFESDPGHRCTVEY
jgi:hypothetical protein